MTGQSVIEQSPHLFPRSMLAEQLRWLGVAAGMTLLVHSSLSRIGYVPA